MSDKNAVTPATLSCPFCQRSFVYGISAVLADSQGKIDVQLAFDAQATKETEPAKAETPSTPFGFSNA